MWGEKKKTILPLLVVSVMVFSFALLFFLPTEKVDAESSERHDYICYSNKNYQITEVKLNGEPVNFTKDERDAFFEYLAANFSSSGSIEYNGNTYTYNMIDKGTCDCPSKENLEAVQNVYNYKVIANGNRSIINFGAIPNVRAKVITDLKAHSNDPDNWLAGGYQLQPTGGEFRLTVPAGESFYVVFYADDAACNGTALAYVQGAASSMISNPYYDAPICVNYRNQYANDTIFSSLVPECYSEQISAKQNVTTTSIQNKINNANNLVQKIQTTPINEKKQCDFTTYNNVTEEYVYTDFLKDGNGQSIGGEYWQAICTEKVRVWYDTPKALTAGEGFNYLTHITVERECTPQKIKEPTIPETCTYGADCIGEYAGGGIHKNDLGAGPNEQFDQCVQFCDGGKYSQSCIDKCYQEIYESDNWSNVSSNSEERPGYLKLDVSQNVITAQQMADASFSQEECRNVLGKVYVRHFQTHTGVIYEYPTRGPLSSCQYISGHCPDNTCYTEHGVGVYFAPTCDPGENSVGTICYEIYTSSTDCAEPGHEYESYLARVNEAKRQFDEVQEAIRKLTIEENANYTIEITDSVTKAKTTYTTTNSDNTVDVTTSGLEVTESNSQSVLIAPSGWGVSKVTGTTSTVKVSDTYTLGVDKSYFLASSRNQILYGFGAYNRLNASEQVKYLDGGNKWYSNPYAKAYNLLNNWPTMIGFDNQSAITSRDSRLDQNIKVKIQNFGSWKQVENLDIDCFYGISSCSGLFCDDPGAMDCDSDTEVCDGGIQYIFRPIELTNPFPSRAPRYNWSLAATDNSNSYYRIDPVAFTNDMVSKGQTIYGALNTPWTIDKDGNNVTGVAQNGGDTSELDYEIILNRDNIRAIRDYNKKYSGDNKDGYLDYDMTCRFDTLSQRTICTSNFLSNKNADSSNGNYVHVMKRGTAGCNNERNGECYNYPTVSRAGDSNE